MYIKWINKIFKNKILWKFWCVCPALVTEASIAS